jgi:hypothetical protein
MPKVSTKDLPPTSAETPDVLIPHPEIENAFTIEIPEEPPVKKLLKKKQVQLLFPYAEKQEAKTLGAKWDANLKMWYYPSVDGSIPEELAKYKAHDVYIEFDDKEYFKNVLTSMKFDKSRKVWMVNSKDFKAFNKL